MARQENEQRQEEAGTTKAKGSVEMTSLGYWFSHAHDLYKKKCDNDLIVLKSYPDYDSKTSISTISGLSSNNYIIS